MVKHGAPALTQALAGTPAAEPDRATAMWEDATTSLSAATHDLQEDVARWRIGLDLLDAAVVRAAGEQAMIHWLQVLQTASSLRGSPIEDRATAALATARELVAQLGAASIDDLAVIEHITAELQRAARYIASVSGG